MHSLRLSRRRLVAATGGLRIAPRAFAADPPRTPAAAPDRLDAAGSLNAAHAAAEIFAGSPPLRAKVLAGKLKILAARYDLDDGKVTPTRTEQA